MDLADIRFWSMALERWSRIAVLIPPAPGPHRLLYLLPGLGADPYSWLTEYAIAPALAPLRSLVVIPEAGRGYYANDPRPSGQGAWENYIMRDVTGFMERAFQVRKGRQNRSIAGISMGGYGALRLALRHPNYFAKTAALSPSLYFSHTQHPRRAAFQTELAAALEPDDHDCFELAKLLAPASAPTPPDRPEIWFAAGRGDAHLEINQSFHAHLQRLKWNHTYVEAEGGHDRAFWMRHIPAMISFLTPPHET